MQLTLVPMEARTAQPCLLLTRCALQGAWTGRQTSRHAADSSTLRGDEDEDEDEDDSACQFFVDSSQGLFRVHACTPSPCPSHLNPSHVEGCHSEGR